MKYPVWFDFGFYSGNEWSMVYVDSNGEVYCHPLEDLLGGSVGYLVRAVEREIKKNG